jgi:hypothetical protein
MQRIHLQWYRDKGRGQEAADANDYTVYQLTHVWPIGLIVCKDNEEVRARWQHLYDTYGVNAMTVYMDVPELVIVTDYDGFFERLVRGMMNQKLRFKHERIEVTAGPWRSTAVSFDSDTKTIKLDFYSALRTGFGYLSEEDMKAIMELL